MKYLMTLYVARYDVNKFMASMDMKATYKYYVEPMEASFEYADKITPNFFRNLIDKSFINELCNKDFCIPAILFNGVLYTAEHVKEISDGTNILFINKEK